MGKITVKYFLNKKTNPIFWTSEESDKVEERYPVYLQVIVKRKNNKIKSQAYKFLPDYKFVKGSLEGSLSLTDKELATSLNNEESEIGKAIAIETTLIQKLIILTRPFEREDFSLSAFSDLYDIGTSPIEFKISNACKNALEYKLRYKSIEGLGNFEKVYKAINWENHFTTIFDALDLVAFSTDPNCEIPFKLTILERTKFLRFLFLLFAEFTKSTHDHDKDYLVVNWIWNNLNEPFYDFLAGKATPEVYIPIKQVLDDLVNEMKEEILLLSSG